MKNISYLIIFFAFFKLNAQVIEKQMISLAKNKGKEIFMPTYGSETIILNIELCKTEKVRIISDFLSKYPDNLKIKELLTDNVKHDIIATTNAIDISNSYPLDRTFINNKIIAFSKITEMAIKIVRSPYMNAVKAPYFLA
jgi:hypothetical protein